MRYNLDDVCDRKGTDCSKWDYVKPIFGHEDVLPLWVADMDFPAAQPIVEALKKRAEHPFYGYTQPGSNVIESVVERLKHKFGWKIEPEWVVFTPGVIPALNIAIRAFTRPGDEVVLQPPVYFPFFSAVTGSGCQIASNPLNLINGRYEMDYADLEKHFSPKQGMHSAPSRAKAIILCNPQNPVGRLWTREEQSKLGEIVISHGGLVISDEIHCEILFKGFQHTPFGSISEEFAQNSVVCLSPSKTFSLAGLEVSSIIIANKKLRQEFANMRSGLVPGPNLFGYTALEAAYRYGDEWLGQVLDYLNANLEFMTSYFENRIPRIKVIKPMGTYLVWLDCRALHLDDEELKDFMRKKARVGFDDGYLFGNGGSGFERINIACPRAILQEALNRIEKAVNSL
jgi:cysteine-S-conjugate beta-lyase